MKKFSLWGYSFFLFLFSFSLFANDPSITEDVSFVDREIIVKFKSSAAADSSYDVERRLDAQKIRNLADPNIVHYKLPYGSDVNRAIQELKNEMDVDFAEPNFILYSNQMPNDPEFYKLWGFNNTGQTNGTAGADIKALNAWNTHTGDGSIVVAVIDTGIDYNHEDLQANAWVNTGEIPNNGIDDDGNGFIDDIHGYDFVNNDGDPMDDHNHGTHCAGTIGAAGNNSIGISGVSWNVKIMGVKFLSAYGSGTLANAVLSINYAVQNGADILSNSWGGGGYSQLLKDAIENSNQAGCVFVAAAGNSGLNTDQYPHYPSSYNVANVISVAAIDHNDELAYFSNYGANTVDIAAPGVSIYSSLSGGKANQTAKYGYMSGTSMATPHVSGALALLKSYQPNLTNTQLKNLLLTKAEPVSNLQGTTVTGGKLNAWNLFINDLIAPDPVTDLSILSNGFYTMDLQWTTTGDDGMSGTASSFDIRYSTQPINDSNFSQAPSAINIPKPMAPGQSQSITVSNLLPNTQYYFAIKVLDKGGNASNISNIVTATTQSPDIIYNDPFDNDNNLTYLEFSSSPGNSLWHLAESSMYYAKTTENNYNTGQHHSGAIETVPISLLHVDSPSLTFNHYLQTENNNYYDKATISVVDLSTNQKTQVFFSVSTNGLTKTEYIDLSAFEEKVIKIEFKFDTVDSILNNYYGWQIHGMQVLGIALNDSTPPAASTLSVGTITSTSIQVQWLAPGDDVNSGTAASYDLRYATFAIDDNNFMNATVINNLPTPSPAGSNESIIVSNLTPNTSYFFALKTKDSSDNQSSLSNILNVSSGENIQPDPVTDIHSSNVTSTSLTLNWTATGDDGMTGTASSYDIRFSESLITENNWSTAIHLQGEPNPSLSGTSETMNLNNLTPNTTYYFAMKVADDMQNISDLSNVYSIKTLSLADIEIIADNPIQATAIEGNSTTVQFQIKNNGEESLSYSISESLDNNPSEVYGQTDPSLGMMNQANEANYHPSRLLIKYKEGSSETDQANILQSVGANVYRSFSVLGVDAIEISGMDLDSAINTLRSNEFIEYVEKDFQVAAFTMPNDTNFSSLYGLHNTGQSNGTNDADIDAVEAWSQTTGSSNVVVAVIDTGVDYNHPDLASNMWVNTNEIPNNNIDDDGNGYIDDIYGYDFYNNDSNPMDGHSHGTHCAGTIGAVGNNNQGVVGVNWNVKIMALKFLSDNGSGYTSDAVSCIQYAVQNGAHILSNSWGGGGKSTTLQNAIESANQAGVLFVAAAGNSNSNNDIKPMYPGAYSNSNIISVAASDRNDAKAWFSSYGALSTDLAAPGVSILSTTPNNQYASYSGTSMATPHVAGAAALIKSANNSLDIQKIKNLLLWSGDPISDFQGKTVTGLRLNANNALNEITDVTAPNMVADLLAIATGFSQITLSWTASGDDGFTGNAAGYELRFSTNEPIDDTNWDQATLVAGLGKPKSSGSAESLVVAGLNFNTTYYFGLKVIDNAGNISLISSAQSTTLSMEEIWTDDMESGINNWSVAKTKGSQTLWHQTSHQSNSPTTAWAYNLESTHQYQTGETNAGTLTSPVIDLTNAVSPHINFKLWREVESWAGNYDLIELRVSMNQGQSWSPVLWKLNSSNPSLKKWTNHVIDISNYAGQQIQLQFLFDTKDALFNYYQGVYIDDVKILGAPQDVSWLDANPTSGDIVYDNTADITLTFDANELYAGNYQANLKVSSNDINQPIQYVPVQFTVTAAPDFTNPGSISDLSMTNVTKTSATIQWTASGDDGNLGKASSYIIKMATTPITNENWDNATLLTNAPIPANSGTQQNFTISNLVSNTTYYFAIKTLDEAQNISALSNVIQGTTLESTPPAAITDLSSLSKSLTSIALQWTASGDDGNVGTATSYDIRYSLTAITNDNDFNDATQFIGEPTPQTSGSSESVTIHGLLEATTYYIAMKVTDDVSNVSSLSNVVAVTTNTQAQMSLNVNSMPTVVVESGATQTRSFTITNNGDEPLTFSISEHSASSTSSTHSTSFHPSQNIDLTVPHVSGEILVKFKDSSNSDSIQQVINQVGIETIQVLDLIGVHHMKVNSHESLDQILSELNQDPNVEYAEPNYELYTFQSPNDTYFSSLYGMHNTGQTGGTVDADIDAVEAWDLTTGSSNIVIGVIDTGVDYNHPDLKDNMWKNLGEIPNNGIDDDNNGFIDDIYGYDFKNSDADPMDDNSHGTHCAGTIAGRGNNAKGVVGVGWNTRIMALKFLGSSGSGSTSGAIQCLQYANLMRQKGVNIVLTSNSWGGGGYSSSLKAAIDVAGQMGMLFVVAAGNSGQNIDSSPSYPAAYSSWNIISVAATDKNDTLASWSNYGSTHVDLAAPGVSILSSIPGGGYGYKSGTSMACPHVAGACGLVWAAFPNDSAAAIRSKLISSVDSKSQLNGLVQTGGRLNVYNAISSNGNIPPAAITNLNFTSIGATQVALSWTAPGENGNIGQASYYDLRYSTSPITENNFFSATQASGLPTPGISGTNENFVLGGLAQNQSYYIAIKSFDGQSTPSAISNILNLTTEVQQSDWLNISPMAGTINKNQTITITLTYTGLPTVGTYSDSFFIQSNDPDQNEVEFPLSMDVIASINQNDLNNDGATNIAINKPVNAKYKVKKSGIKSKKRKHVSSTDGPQYMNDGDSSNDGSSPIWVVPDNSQAVAMIDLKAQYMIESFKLMNGVNYPNFDHSTQNWIIKTRSGKNKPWKTVAKGSEDFAVNPTFNNIDLEKPIKAQYIKLIIKSWWGKGAAISELEIIGTLSNDQSKKNKKHKKKNK